MKNRYDWPVFLVTDDWFTYSYQERLIQISFARTKMVEGARVFGYFLPALKSLEPQTSFETIFELEWPQKLNRIWNEQEYANPHKGHNKLQVMIGYGFTENIPEREGVSVEESIQRWQKISGSNYLDIVVE